VESGYGRGRADDGHGIGKRILAVCGILLSFVIPKSPRRLRNLSGIEFQKKERFLGTQRASE
jgi:hypothetical protein